MEEYENARKIMIVDDQQVNLMLLGKILNKAGYNVCSFLSGEECLESIYVEMPDLIILDIDMPGGLNGYEVCAQLKDNPVTEDTPVFFLSSMAKDLQILNDDDEDGADGYLTKPINKQELLEQVHIALTDENP